MIVHDYDVIKPIGHLKQKGQIPLYVPLTFNRKYFSHRTVWV